MRVPLTLVAVAVAWLVACAAPRARVVRVDEVVLGRCGPAGERHLKVSDGCDAHLEELGRAARTARVPGEHCRQLFEELNRAAVIAAMRTPDCGREAKALTGATSLELSDGSRLRLNLLCRQPGAAVFSEVDRLVEVITTALRSAPPPEGECESAQCQPASSGCLDDAEIEGELVTPSTACRDRRTGRCLRGPTNTCEWEIQRCPR